MFMSLSSFADRPDQILSDFYSIPLGRVKCYYPSCAHHFVLFTAILDELHKLMWNGFLRPLLACSEKSGGFVTPIIGKVRLAARKRVDEDLPIATLV
jgi:hypothetical protein